jgi:hypothetical protein
MKRYLGPTYYGHPYLDGRGVFLDGHPLDHAGTPREDLDSLETPPPESAKRANPYLAPRRRS